MNDYTIRQSKFAYFFTTSNASAPLWFLVRLYLGYEFLMAGWEKVGNAAWFGSGAGKALTGFVQNAVAKASCAPGCHPDVYQWYASFLQSSVLPHVMIWSNAVVVGEIMIGLGLIVGLCTRTAAFFAFFMAFNFLLSGSVSINPTLVLLAIGIMIAHRVAGYWGLDRFVQPYLRRMCTARNKN